MNHSSRSAAAAAAEAAASSSAAQHWRVASRPRLQNAPTAVGSIGSGDAAAAGHEQPWVNGDGNASIGLGVMSEGGCSASIGGSLGPFARGRVGLGGAGEPWQVRTAGPHLR